MLPHLAKCIAIQYSLIQYSYQKFLLCYDRRRDIKGTKLELKYHFQYHVKIFYSNFREMQC